MLTLNCSGVAWAYNFDLWDRVKNVESCGWERCTLILMVYRRTHREGAAVKQLSVSKSFALLGDRTLVSRFVV